MWAIKNKTPYLAERSWVQDKDANKIWVVAVKATFDVSDDGSTKLAAQQLPVLGTSEHEGEPGQSSLAYEADLFGVKTCTDVLVRGHAWTNPARRTSSVDVQLR